MKQPVPCPFAYPRATLTLPFRSLTRRAEVISRVHQCQFKACDKPAEMEALIDDRAMLDDEEDDVSFDEETGEAKGGHDRENGFDDSSEEEDDEDEEEEQRVW